MNVDLSRAEAVYEHYREHQQSVLKAQAMYGTLAWRHRPRVSYMPGARPQLRRAVRRSSPPLLIAVNHVRESDPLVLAAAGFLSPLRSRIGHIRVLAKDSLFVDPEQRAKIDALGGIPVFRPKDHDVRLSVTSAHQLFEVCADRMARGDSIAIFPEGTCNPGDPAILQKISSGVGHIAVRARQACERPPQLVAIGLTYPADGGRPRVVISAPEELSTSAAASAAAVTRLVAQRLQSVVTRAVDG